MFESQSLPAVVISLDLEKRWGFHDKLALDMDARRQSLEHEEMIAARLLKLLSDRNIRATWACVGALGCRDWNEYFARAPQPPSYHDPSLQVSPRYADLDPKGHFHFAPELLDTIRLTPGQELATHTFSHILLREPGVTARDVEADLKAVNALWEEKFGVKPVSLVFPRNQHAFLEVVRAGSIRIWRGNPVPWYYESNEASSNHLPPRALRLLDSLNPLSRRATMFEGDMTRASLFLRTNLPRHLWELHSIRIRRELVAMQPGQIFHMWWHPHNLGGDRTVRLGRVEQVLDMLAERCTRGVLVSRCMADLVSDCPIGPNDSQSVPVPARAHQVK